MGLHAGVRKRFRAKVVKLRKMFPRIVVKVCREGLHRTRSRQPCLLLRVSLTWAFDHREQYIATEASYATGTQAHALELPDPITAYLTMTDVEPGTLILP